MLCLSRRKGESVYIYPEEIPEDMTATELFAGGPIKIVITEITQSQCRLAIKAPSELLILRNELDASQ